MNGTFFKAHRQYASSQLPGYGDVSRTVIRHMKVVKKFSCCVSKYIKIVHIPECTVSSKALSCPKKTNISTISLLLLEQHLEAAESEECKIQRCWGRDEGSEKHQMGDSTFQWIPWHCSIQRALPLKLARDSNYRLLGGIKGSLWEREILRSIKNGTMTFPGIPCA